MNDLIPYAETCGAKTRAGTPCKKSPVRGRRRCKLHGGNSRRGVFHGRYKHGRFTEQAIATRRAERERKRKFRQMVEDFAKRSDELIGWYERLLNRKSVRR